MNGFVNLGCTVPKQGKRTEWEVVNVEDRWMVVREHISEFVGLGTMVPGR